MHKDEAMEFTKNYIDYHAEKKRAGDKQESVNDIIGQQDEWPPLFQESFNLTEFKYAEGMAGMKITKCRWHEVLKELNDPEFCYATCCHYDFKAAELANENFVLTRKCTLMQGDSCCDFIWHDTRIDKECKHPDEEFWEKI